jgi:Tol biopolymer transport system component
MNMSRKSILYTILLICELILFRSVFMSISLQYSVDEERARNNKENIDHISFSNDGNRILFERKRGNSPSTINTYNLKIHELSTYLPPKGEYWTMARYSHDDRHLVFCIQRGSSPLQIGIMDSDGKNYRQIIRSHNGGEHPSFSHSDDKIIFVKSAPINKMEPACDIYETDLRNGSETRLTWFNLHYIISTPFELPDGETIIFSAVGPPKFTPEWDGRSYMVKKGDKHLPDPFVVPGNKNPLLGSKESTRNPLVSSDGKRIVFQGLALRPNSKYTDAQQYFEYFSTGVYRRITHIPIPHTSICSADLSPDGQYLAIVLQDISGRDEPNRIAICNIQDGTYRIINLPDKPSRIFSVQIDRNAEQINPADPAQAPGS